jgi:hypothetical protein
LPVGGITEPLYQAQRMAAVHNFASGLPFRRHDVKNGLSRSGKSPTLFLFKLASRARGIPNAGCRTHDVSMRSRHYSGGRPRGCVAASRTDSIRTVCSCLKSRPPASLLALPRLLKGEAAAATVGTSPSVSTHHFAPEGQICRPKYSLQYTVYYAQNREFLPVDSARLQVLLSCIRRGVIECDITMVSPCGQKGRSSARILRSPQSSSGEAQISFSTLGAPAVMSHAVSHMTRCLAPRGGSRERSGFALPSQPECCPFPVLARRSGARLGLLPAPPLLATSAHHRLPLVPSRPQGPAGVLAES